MAVEISDVVTNLIRFFIFALPFNV